MAPFKIKVEGWALHMGLAVVARTAVDAGTEQEHGPWLSILKAADGMRPAESIDIKGRDQLTKLREAIDYALQKPKIGKQDAPTQVAAKVTVAPGCEMCKHAALSTTREPCASCSVAWPMRVGTSSRWEPGL